MMVVLNESFKTLLRDILPNKEQAEALEKAFVEVVNIGLQQRIGLDGLKIRTIVAMGAMLKFML
ncbi:hypothetical protein [Helicobacter himalayensis]|uniref:hypothetical protein n=1 Tax=Helicobacter himalayensis TaxID=1591088 RepID=UPI00082A95B0|nr:hypothetical protein [Helicobacter himalayensis]